MWRNYILGIVITCCPLVTFCQSKTSISAIQGVRIRRVLPNVTPQGKIAEYTSDSAEVYYSGNLRLYYLPYELDSVNLDTRNVYFSEIRHHYFIYNIDSAYGYDYDPKRVPVKKRLPVDSLLSWQWVSNTNVYSMITVNQAKLISAIKNADSGTLYESYSFTNIDTSAHGTFFFGYSQKLNHVPYSLSPEIDSIKQMKLVKILYSQDPRYLVKENFHVDRINTENEIEEIPIIRPEVIHYFANYKVGK